MQTALYIIWILVPLAFYLLALWSRLEQSTQIKKGKKRSKEAGDLLKQAYFVTGCSVATFLLDAYMIPKIESMIPPSIPIEFVKLILYPIVLLVAGILVGGSDPVRIQKAPSPTQRRRPRR